MLDYNLSDKEQVEMIRNWWKNTGQHLLTAAAVGLALVYGWQFWQKHQLQRSAQASVIYQQLAMAEQQGNSAMVSQVAQTLKNGFSSTPYASLSALVVARDAVTQKNTAAAQTQLQWVIDHSKMSALRQIARLRLARLLASQKQFTQAEAQLQPVEEATFMPAIHELRGDLEAGLGHSAQAQSEYQAAKKGFVNLGLDEPLLDMKLKA